MIYLNGIVEKFLALFKKEKWKREEREINGTKYIVYTSTFKVKNINKNLKN